MYFCYSCSNLLCWKTSEFVIWVNPCELWTQALIFGRDREFYVRKSNFSTRVKMCLLEPALQREPARMSLKTIKETNIYFCIPYFISGNLEFIQRALRSPTTKIKCLIRHKVKQLNRTTWHRKKISSFFFIKTGIYKTGHTPSK